MVDSAVIDAILKSGGVGTAIILVLILTNILYTRFSMQRVEAEVSNWKAAFEAERNARETERAANNELRATVIVQTQRADAAVETAKLAGELLEELRRRTSAAT